MGLKDKLSPVTDLHREFAIQATLYNFSYSAVDSETGRYDWVKDTGESINVRVDYPTQPIETEGAAGEAIQWDAEIVLDPVETANGVCDGQRVFGVDTQPATDSDQLRQSEFSIGKTGEEYEVQQVRRSGPLIRCLSVIQ